VITPGLLVVLPILLQRRRQSDPGWQESAMAAYLNDDSRGSCRYQRSELADQPATGSIIAPG
jgi:hypothetical protein